jgi:hypothetical protein
MSIRKFDVKKNHSRERENNGKWGKDDLTDRINNACINVHKALGPGFVESIYRNALLIELKRQLLAYEAEKETKISYGGTDVEFINLICWLKEKSL